MKEAPVRGGASVLASRPSRETRYQNERRFSFLVLIVLLGLNEVNSLFQLL